MYGDRNFGSRRGGFSPVNVGEEIDVKIEAVGEKGDGIAKVKGFVLFVPGVKESDEVRIKVTKVLRNVGFAEVVGQAEGSVAGESEEGSSEDSANDSTDKEAAEEVDQESEDSMEEDAADPQDS